MDFRERRGQPRNQSIGRAGVGAVVAARTFLYPHSQHPHQLQPASLHVPHPPPPPPPPPAYQHLQHHHHGLSVIADTSSRLFAPSLRSSTGSVPVDHAEYASILSFRQRLSGSGIVPRLVRSHDGRSGEDSWEERHRRADVHRMSLDDDPSFRQTMVKEWRESREDVNGSGLFLPELDGSRRSALLSAKLFLDEGRPQTSATQKGELYHDGVSSADLRRGRFEIDFTDDDSFLFRSHEQLRKRSRDEGSDVEIGRLSKHKRFNDPGLAIIPGTPDGLHIHRQVLPSSARRTCREMEDGPSSDQRSPSTPSFAKVSRKVSGQVKTPQPNSKRAIIQSSGSSPKLETGSQKYQKADHEKYLSSGKKSRDKLAVGNRNYSRVDRLGSPRMQKKVQRSVAGIGNAIVKKHDGSDRMELDQEEHRESDPCSKSFCVVEAKPRKALKSRFSRATVSDAKVCGSVSKTKAEERNEKHVAKLTVSDVEDVIAIDVEQISKSTRPEHTLDDSVRENTHDQQQINYGDGSAQVSVEKLQPLDMGCHISMTGLHHIPAVTPTPKVLGVRTELSVCNKESSNLSEVLKLQHEIGSFHHQGVLSGMSGWSAALFPSCTQEPPTGSTSSKQSSEVFKQIEYMPLELQCDQKKSSVGCTEDTTLPVISPVLLRLDISDQSMECPRLMRAENLPNSKSHQVGCDIPKFRHDSSEGISTGHGADCLEQCSAQLWSVQKTPSPSQVLCADMSMEIGCKRTDSETNSIDASKAVTAEREVRLFGKSLKATMPIDINQDALASTVTVCSQDAPPKVSTAEDTTIGEKNVNLLNKNLESPSQEGLLVEMARLVLDSISTGPNNLHSSKHTLATDSNIDNTVPDKSIVMPESSSHQQITSTEPVKLTVIEANITPVPTVSKEEVSYVNECAQPEEEKAEVHCLLAPDKQANQAPVKQLPLATIHQLPRPRTNITPVRTGANTWRRPADSHAVPAIVKSASPVNQIQVVGNQKSIEVASYVRKGNSLVRAPVAPVSCHAGSVSGAGKDAARKPYSSFSRMNGSYPNFQTRVQSTKTAYRQVFSSRKIPINASALSSLNLEKLQADQQNSKDIFLHDGQSAALHQPQVSTRPSTPETSKDLVMEMIQNESHAGKCTGNAKSLVPESIDPMPTVVQSKSILPVFQQSSTPKSLETLSTFYVKSKANQLVASIPGSIMGPPLSSTMATALYSNNKKGNQLVRNTIKESNVNNTQFQGSASAETISIEDMNGTKNTLLPTTLRKVFKKRAHVPSRVWTLKTGTISSAKSVLPLFFPWKRHPVSSRKFKTSLKMKRGSLLSLISKKLQRSRKVQPVYTRSADGFTLHRSGVRGLSGANLKWTKSIERCSKQASEEATKAVAAVEKRRREEKRGKNVSAKVKPYKRSSQVSRRTKVHARERIITVGLVRYKMDASRRTLQRLPDQWHLASGETSSLGKIDDSTFLSTPRRLSIGGTEYVRLGNGHQLVRDPKAVTRALATEKIRWSLHSARFRRAKKQQYCLFYTRFGKCNKRDGECQYIHDPEKVAICTKFLKGTCTGTNCVFSHKVVPERMPDCSFFLEGLCINENCPYRHVSVNPSAQVCEGFLKGFCGQGDQCDKKHTLVCPTFALTGECHDRLSCKLHHPKRKGKMISCSKFGKIRSRKKRRYFVSDNLGLREQEKTFNLGSSSVANDEIGEFIAIPNLEFELDESDELQKRLSFLSQQLPSLQTAPPGEEDMDAWIKPVLLWKKQIDAH